MNVCLTNLGLVSTVCPFLRSVSREKQSANANANASTLITVIFTTVAKEKRREEDADRAVHCLRNSMNSSRGHTSLHLSISPSLRLRLSASVSPSPSLRLHIYGRRADSRDHHTPVSIFFLLVGRRTVDPARRHVGRLSVCATAKLRRQHRVQPPRLMGRQVCFEWRDWCH